MHLWRSFARVNTSIHLSTNVTQQTSKMSTSGALYTSASLKAANAPSYSTLEGKLDPQLLQALKEMKFDFMTPVQEKVMGGMPSLSSDWYVVKLQVCPMMANVIKT